jgi:hypothetical protein
LPAREQRLQFHEAEPEEEPTKPEDSAGTQTAAA